MPHNEFVTNHELTPDQAQAIYGHSSPLVHDAEHVFSFLQEIGQVGKMKVASKGQGPLPQGNWIHRFTEFQDIVEAFRVVFRLGADTAKRILAANLRTELLTNLTHLMLKTRDGGLLPITAWGSGVCAKMQGDVGGTTD